MYSSYNPRSCGCFTLNLKMLCRAHTSICEGDNYLFTCTDYPHPTPRQMLIMIRRRLNNFGFGGYSPSEDDHGSFYYY